MSPIDGVGVLNLRTIWPANTTNPSVHLPSHLVTSSTISHYSVSVLQTRKLLEFAFNSFSGSLQLSYHYFSLSNTRSNLVFGLSATSEDRGVASTAGLWRPTSPPPRSFACLASAQPAANFPLVATHSLSLPRFILSSPPRLSFYGYIVRNERCANCHFLSRLG